MGIELLLRFVIVIIVAAFCINISLTNKDKTNVIFTHLSVTLFSGSILQLGTISLLSLIGFLLTIIAYNIHLLTSNPKNPYRYSILILSVVIIFIHVAQLTHFPCAAIFQFIPIISLLVFFYALRKNILFHPGMGMASLLFADAILLLTAIFT